MPGSRRIVSGLSIFFSQRAHDHILVLRARKDAHIPHARQSQRLLAVEMLRSLGEDQPRAAVGGRAPIDATRRDGNVQAAQCVHEFRKDVHVGENVVIHFETEIQVEGAR